MSRKGWTGRRRGFIITRIGRHTLPVALISQESDRVVIDCNKAFIDFKSDTCITRQVTFPVLLLCIVRLCFDKGQKSLIYEKLV